MCYCEATNEYFPSGTTFVLNEARAVKIWLEISSGVTVDRIVSAMLNEGTVNPFEPYVGNQPSPSINYPQEVKCPGDSGSISGKVLNSNIVDYVDKVNHFIKNDNGKYTAIKPTTEDYYGGQGMSISDKIVPNQTYSVMGWGTNGVEICIGTIVNGVTIWKEVREIGKHQTPGSFSFTEDEIENAFFQLQLMPGYPSGDYEVWYSFVAGNEIKEWEPYIEQPFTALTPNGLLGLPVASGGNNVDSDGQQYLSNYKDYALGKNIEQVQKIRLTSQQAWWYEQGQTNGTHNFELDLVSEGYGKCSRIYHYAIATTSTHFRYINVTWDDVEKSKIYVWSHMMTVSFSADSEMNSLDKWKQFLDENEVYAYYILEEPIETDIPSEELAQYNALHMNFPNTTIINDAGAYTEVEYALDAKIYIDQHGGSINPDDLEDYVTEGELEDTLSGYVTKKEFENGGESGGGGGGGTINPDNLKNYVTKTEFETALDEIIAIQEALIGGDE